MNKRKWLALAGLLVCLGLAAGCSDDDGPADPPPGVVLPADPDALAAEFVTLYQEMDAGRLEEIMHADARVFLLASVIQEWEQSSSPLTSVFFDRDSLLSIHGHIFAGDSGRGPGGIILPPTASVEVDVFEKAGSWQEYNDPEDDFPGLAVQAAPFQFLINFNNPDQHRYQVQGLAVFYVVPVDRDGSTGWQLLGWRETEPFCLQATEQVPWCGVLSVYR